MSDLLFKYCKRAHFPEKGGKIRIGTTHSFRSHENSAVRDDSEARFALRLRFDGEHFVGRSWLENISLGTSLVAKMNMGAASFSMRNLILNPINTKSTSGVVWSTDDLRILERDGSQRFRMCGGMNIHFAQVDSYIFCMSTEGGEGSVIDDDGYDSSWSLPRNYAEKFSSVMANSILERFLFGEGLTKEICHDQKPAALGFNELVKEGGEVILKVKHNVVEYVPKDIVVNREEDLPAEVVLDLFDKASFAKPLEFSTEREYRFSFEPMFCVKGRYYAIPLKLDPLFVDAAPFLDFLRR